MNPIPPINPQIAEPCEVSEEEIWFQVPAQGIYSLVIGALIVAENDDTPGASERRKAIALAADAYFPLTGLEKPS